jgi:hypothetical protein
MSQKQLKQILLMVSLFISSCHLLPNTTLPDPDIDTFELPEQKIESEDIENPEYVLLFDIHRVGTVIDPTIEWVQEDKLLLEIRGKGHSIYGSEDYGTQKITSDNGECTLVCEGNIGYEVWGGIGKGPNGCLFKAFITQLPGPASCTSSCAPAGYKIPINTGVGQVPLDVLEADFIKLKKGVPRTESLTQFMGNMIWESVYTLKSVSGKIDKSICDYEE